MCIRDRIQSFQGAIQTDLSPEQLGQLACIGTQIKSGNIVFATFPAEYFKQTRQYDPVFKKNVFVWDVDFQVLRDYVGQFNDGKWPSQTTAPTTQTASTEEAVICP